MATTEHFDAIVFGATTRGMVAAYILNMLGYRAVVLERAPDLGGGDGSFQLADGTWFDFGMHVLDENRSEVATRLFLNAIDNDVHRVLLRRAVVLRNKIMPYAPEAAQMPNELRAMLPDTAIFDDLGDQKPNRENLSRCYGEKFTNLIFDEVLPSYPTEHRHLEFGVDESELLVNIYPWFFPRADRSPKSGDESRQFHDRLRDGVDQYVLYPRDGGFGEYCRAFSRKLDSDRVEVITKVGDIRIDVDQETHQFRKVEVLDRCLQADRYFWASSWPELCGLLGVPCQHAATDRIVLGSFRLDRPVLTDFHEILFGDPSHSINRVHFPGAVRGSESVLMQVEFAFPEAESRSTEAEYWRDEWVASLRRLGIIDDSHRITAFDFKTRPLHFNGYGMEGVALQDADPNLIDGRSNVFPVVPSMANLNLNSHIPRDVEYVTSVLARVDADE